MGCCASQMPTEIRSNEETIIESTENRLGFSDLNSGIIDKEFSRFPHQSYITEKQLIMALEALKIDVSFFKNPQSLMYKFYQKFYKTSFGYSITNLALLGIFLGKEDINRKVIILFQNYDRNCSRKLEYSEFNDMMHEMVMVSSAIIELAKNENPENSGMLETYSKQIRRAEDHLSKFIYLVMANGKANVPIDQMDFIVSFKDKNIQKLCSASGFRQLAMGLYSSNSSSIDKAALYY